VQLYAMIVPRGTIADAFVYCNCLRIPKRRDSADGGAREARR